MSEYQNRWPSLGFSAAFQRHISPGTRTRLRHVGASFIAFALFTTAAHAQQGIAFTTEAGVSGFGTEDGTGTAARFVQPIGVAVDGSGNVYVADNVAATIRKITPAGVVTTLAGSPFFTGNDNAIGTAAHFSGPNGIAIDGTGNLYVTDQFNHAIRKVTPAGVVTTFAGSTSGVSGFLPGLGTAARFNRPSAIAIDGTGNLYVTDTVNFAIRKITPAGLVSNLAGGGPGLSGSTDDVGAAARFNFGTGAPGGLDVDAAGNVYVADSNNSTIRMITPGGTVTTLAGLAGSPGYADATGSAARFRNPRGLVVDRTASLIYVAEVGNATIRKITTGGVVTTVAGVARFFSSTDGAALATARFNILSGLAIDGAGNIYAADANNSNIRLLTPGGVVSTFAGFAGGTGNVDGFGSAARFTNPRGVAADLSGNHYVVDNLNQTIRKITAAGVVTTFAGLSNRPGSVDGSGFLPGTAAQFNGPLGVALDSSDNVYVADSNNHTIRKITPAGVVTTFAGLAGTSGISDSTDGTGGTARFNTPNGIAVDRLSGTIFVADTNSHTIRKITPGGVVTTLAGGGGAGLSGRVDATGTAARFNTPRALAVDVTGTVLYVADSANNSIRQVTVPGGVVTTLAGSTAGAFGLVDAAGTAARFSAPQGIAVDLQGVIYVADTNNNAIRAINAGVVTTIGGACGGACPGRAGKDDGTGGPGNNASFWVPTGLAVDGRGVLYIGDSANNEIRRGARPTPAVDVADVDGDGKSDFVVYRPSTGTWFALTSSAGALPGFPFGQPGDVPLGGDFTGNGKAGVAVWRPSNGLWFVVHPDNTISTYSLGVSGDIPLLGNFDGDGKADLVNFHPPTGLWTVRVSSEGYGIGGTAALGKAGDIPVPADYDGDTGTDIAVFRPSTGMWFIRQSSTDYGKTIFVQWGASGDIPVPTDYDGDGKADIAVWRPSNGTWYILTSSTNYNKASARVVQWGVSGDIPVPGDFDGDKKADLAVYRPATGNWFVLASSSGFASIHWGEPGDIPANAAAIENAVTVALTGPRVSIAANLTNGSDFDADGKSDFTVYRPTASSTWFNLRSSTNYSTFLSPSWGSSGDIIVPGDYDGDGFADFAVYRPAEGNWYIINSDSNYDPSHSITVQWGIPGDIPVPGDYDGDGTTDIAVYRPSTGVWYIKQSSTGFETFVMYQWGVPGDVPLAGDYDGDGLLDLAVYRPSTGVWFILQSSTGFATFTSTPWGGAGDIPVPGDFDGDGKTDVAVYRPSSGSWFILQSTAGFASVNWGALNDIPVPGDFDGDGRTDVAVYRPSTGAWYTLRSTAGFFTVTWGVPGDIPILKRQ